MEIEKYVRQALLIMRKKKLTLRIEENLIDRAKRQADLRGTSVSRMVANYFAVLEEKKAEEESLPPLTRSLTGALKGSGIDEDDYYRYLEAKHQ